MGAFSARSQSILILFNETSCDYVYLLWQLSACEHLTIVIRSLTKGILYFHRSRVLKSSGHNTKFLSVKCRHTYNLVWISGIAVRMLASHIGISVLTRDCSHRYSYVQVQHKSTNDPRVEENMNAKFSKGSALMKEPEKGSLELDK